ncbi:hypothetical protein T08_14358 [Trichinella sp. T8]|nr:hypothetical protein T08_14358 [Trichinella sp. T8]
MTFLLSVAERQHLGKAILSVYHQDLDKILKLHIIAVVEKGKLCSQSKLYLLNHTNCKLFTIGSEVVGWLVVDEITFNNR